MAVSEYDHDEYVLVVLLTRDIGIYGIFEEDDDRYILYVYICKRFPICN